MRIDELLHRGLPTVSFEFFPPKSEEGFASLYRTIDDLHPLKPSSVSVSYGAGGSTRQKTVDLVSRIQNELKIRSMAHLTCVGHTAEEIRVLDQLWESGNSQRAHAAGDPRSGNRNLPPLRGICFCQ
jgi:methylenetetrahydrofolate reductase (NADPH)